MYYLQSRYYDAEIGRFINADSQIAGVDDNVQGYNMYSYCMNNPINMTDGSGNWPKWLSGVVNVVSGATQMIAGAALGATVGWTGIGAVAAGILIANGAATAAQGIGQIINDVTNSEAMFEDNILRTQARALGEELGGEVGGSNCELFYDAAVSASSLMATAVAIKPDILSALDGKMPQVVNSRLFSHNGGYGYKIGNSIEILYRNPNAQGGTGGTIFSYDGYWGKYRIDWDPAHSFHSHPPGHG